MTEANAPRPNDVDDERLRRNLAALERSDPDLAARLRLPVEGDHVRVDARGQAHYRLHRGEFVLDLDDTELAAALAGAAAAPRLLHLGLGRGELLRAALAAAPEARQVAWERDPWLLRSLLARNDLSEPLLRGRLRLALGVDLLRHLQAPLHVLAHPRLAAVYREERAIVEHGLPARRVALVTGGLFVEPLARALSARGLGVWPLEARRQAREELEYTVRALRPELVLAVNHLEGLAEFCAELGVPLAMWEVDPATSAPRPPRCSTERTFLFAHRRAVVSAFRSAGFENAHYLPLAADPELRRPLPDVERDLPVAFVGASLVDDAARLAAAFDEQWCRWRGATPAARAEAAALRAELARAQAAAETLVLPGELAARAPGFLAAFEAGELGVEDPRVLVGEEASSRRRLETLAACAPLGLHVWGDRGWRALEAAGVTYHGPAGHRDELTRIYARGRVHLDVGRLYQPDLVTMRVFDVLACGGVIVAERNAALEELLEPEVEVATWRTRAELGARVRRLLDEPAEALELARRGREAVLRHHTIAGRLAAILQVVGGGPPPALRGDRAASVDDQDAQVGQR